MSIPQSLPSFAQAFSSSSLSDIAISNALPPIQPRPAHSPPRISPPSITKKRSREDPSRTVDTHNVDGSRQSPMTVRIKEEDRDDPQRPPQSLHLPSRDASATPLSKKRRVTLSGPPHGPATPASSSADQTTPVPISPVVPAFPVPDDAIPRTLAKQQMGLVDQRRGSTSATAGPSAIVSGPLLTRSPPGDPLGTSKMGRIGRISPSTSSVRCAGNAVASGSQATASARPLTPPTIIVSNSQPSTLTSAEPAPKPQHPVTHSLPPPPISFARRRAAQSGGRKKKPADILISPRGAGPSDPLAPVIQSAPPVADPGRFPMAIPRLPLAMGNPQTTRRVATNVPPTPTRFSLQGAATPSISSTARTMQPSPPNPSVPIANTLVPPTPHAFQHPGYSGDKSAFLAPFELFYDALNDSKQLKTWLSDQLQKSNALMTSLKQQQEKMDEMVEDLVEKRTRVMREEITILRQRMESLEEALLAVRAEGSCRSQDAAAYGYGGKFHQNGGPEPPSSYRFPSSEQRRPEMNAPAREQDQLSSSPPMEVTRRLSVSATTASSPALHGSLALGGHNRVASGSQPTKGTPPGRPQERSTSNRQTESRPARPYFPGSSPAR